MRLCRSLSSTSLHVPVRGADVPVQVIPSFLSGVQKKKSEFGGQEKKKSRHSDSNQGPIIIM